MQSEIKRKLKKEIIVQDITDKTIINAIRLNRLIFDFDSGFVQIAFGIGNIDIEGNYIQKKGEIILRDHDEFSSDMQTLFSIDIPGFYEKVLEYVETIIEKANTK